MFNKKRRHFKKMLKDITQVIWEKELTKFTLLHEREVVRQQYDKAMQAVNTIDAKLEGAGEATKKDIETQKEAILKTADDLKKELDSYDTKIEGGPPSELVPEGSMGVTNELQKWAERREVIKSFIKFNT